MKTGRNDKCPCGSGKKYKYCHGSKESKKYIQDDKYSQITQQNLFAIQKQREKQQGLGTPITSTLVNGIRSVAVGDKIFSSNEWKTFHDFLTFYLRNLLGKTWFNSELKKEYKKQHQIVKWHTHVYDYLNNMGFSGSGVFDAPMTGAISSFLGLSYNMYLIAHNAEIQDELIRRLKNETLFHGALYETYVAALFINAGYTLEFEDERDPKTKHCEFAAISNEKKYSVEAKSRLPFKANVNIGNQLYSALCKEAKYDRIIFIDINVPETTDQVKNEKWQDDVIKTIRTKEKSLTINGIPAPEAYVFITNFPYQYYLDSDLTLSSAFLDGFKIKDFPTNTTFMNLKQMRKSRDKCLDILDLFVSIKTHYEIPSTFDGEIPEFAFKNIENRLVIGNRYIIPDKDGKEVTGELVDATVLEDKKLVWGIYKLENDTQVIATCPLTDDEFEAYKKYPETFFGHYKEKQKEIKSPLNFFDFLYNSYCKTPKEKLLGFLKDHSNYGTLKNMDQEELAVFYCESIVNTNYHKTTKE